MAVPAQPSKSEFTISAFEMLPTTMPTKTHYLQSSPLKIQDAANLTMFSCQTGANENHICWKMPSGFQVLPKSRTKTEAWILLTPPDTAQVNMTSSVKMSLHITWDSWSWFSMLRKARAKQLNEWYSFYDIYFMSERLEDLQLIKILFFWDRVPGLRTSGELHLTSFAVFHTHVPIFFPI